MTQDLDGRSPTSNVFGYPDLGVGIGLRAPHFRTLLEERPSVDWLEIISENFMETDGRPLEILEDLAETYPIVMHGVSLSIGSTAPLDRSYLRELAALRDRVRARWVSDHLCWTGTQDQNGHDLYPLPYTREALAHVIDRVRAVQDFLGQPILLENPSTYVRLEPSSIPEAEFLAEVAQGADCGILLDVNNVFVSAYNHGLDAGAYLRALPLERIAQLHVAGHTHLETHLLDTHVGPVVDAVWRLFATAQRATGGVSTLLEWDAEIPDFATVHREALRAHEFLGRSS